MLVVLLTATTLVTTTYSQCLYITDATGNHETLNLCKNNGGNTYTRRRCKTASPTSEILQEFFSSPSCSGAFTSQTNVNSTFPGNRRCTGITCALKRIEYSDTECKTPTSLVQEQFSYIDPFCRNGVKHWCDSTFRYIFSYGNSDLDCFNNGSLSATLVKQRIGACLGTGTKYRWENCRMGNPKPALTIQKTKTVGQYPPTNTGCGGSPDTWSQSYFQTKCDNSSGSAQYPRATQEYCASGRGIYRYTYNTTGCVSGSLTAAVYYNTGCGAPPTLRLFEGLTNESVRHLDCNAQTPPPISFGSAKYGLLQAYSDKQCTKFVYGAYIRADGNCNAHPKGIQGMKVMCTIGGGMQVTTYSPANCLQNSLINSTTYPPNSCVMVPGSDNLNMPIYMKSDGKCGSTTGNVDPYGAPNLRVIGGSWRCVPAWLMIFLGVILVVFH